MKEHYTFGDNDRAAQRLRLLAAAYEPTSAALLRAATHGPPRLAVDLGAGLGLTTRLVHAATGATSTMGLDASVRYVEQASRDAPPGVVFAVHDVTRVPFPGGAPDFVYARFLLTHLSDPRAALEAWRGGCATDATLVLEETAELTSENAALSRYYRHVEALQQHYGQALRVGRDLADLAIRAGWKVVDARTTAVPVAASTMARLHVENLRTWRGDAFARERFDAGELEALERALEAIADGREAADVRVEMGQVVAERTPLSRSAPSFGRA